jgi:Bacterial PH domain
VGVASVLGVVLTVKTGDPRWLFLGLPFSLILFVVGRLAPTAYRLATDGIHVERRAGDKVFPYRAIRDADRQERPVNGLSVTASKGVFGRFGRFWNARLGFYRLYLSNTNGVVWLHTDSGLVGLSPDRPDEFLARLRGRLGRRSC